MSLIFILEQWQQTAPGNHLRGFNAEIFYHLQITKGPHGVSPSQTVKLRENFVKPRV
jgi:hypothetical protein